MAGEAVIVATRPGLVVALNRHTGAVYWKTDLKYPVLASPIVVHGTVAPTVAGDVVLVGTEDGVVFGLQAHTGEVLWDFKTPGKITGSPIVVRDTMYVVSHDGKLYAVTESE
jgi:outer membrane protein assembly factor BamB